MRPPARPERGEIAALAPLILTLALDRESFARFDGLRRRHFPPERNLIPAHLTLFHHLPGAEAGRLLADLAAAARDRGPLPLRVSGLLLLGRGVAFRVESPELQELRARLAAAWSPWLGAQDRQPFRPHVTVQNKVAPADARALHAALSNGFAPFVAWGEGLLLWRYLGGPWQELARVPFGAA